MSDKKSEQRTANRKVTYAKILLNGMPGYIRNISSRGIGTEFLMPPGCEVGEQIEVGIHPEVETGVEAFSCAAIVKWIRRESPYYQIGLESDSANGAARMYLQKLLEMYS